MEARCGLEVIDLRSGRMVHSLYFDSLVDELYDVMALAPVRNPMAIGFRSNEICRFIGLDL